MEEREMRRAVHEALVPTEMLRALEVGLTPEARDWLRTRRSEALELDKFVHRMAEELASNSYKGDRIGWLEAGAATMVGEVLYHSGKLSLAVREAVSGKPTDPRTTGFTLSDVQEYAADVANCAMMVNDCAVRRMP